jgi:ElaB/YqjD/DUF883 family membrane-anchored ribosome-binding protein
MSAIAKKEEFMDEVTDPDETERPAKEVVAEATEGLKEKVIAAADKTRRSAEAAWSEARSRASSLQSQCEAQVREKPTQALFIALGIGILIGLVMRRY